MILIATFIATGSSSVVPIITVEQFKTPEYGGGQDPVGKTKRTCETMGETYKTNIVGWLPNGTRLVMTCMPERNVVEDE